MAPLIVGLLGQGLNLLANAALAKGKEYVEEKTGIKLDDVAAGKPIDPETASKLKIAEMQHEEELLKIRLEDNRLDAALQEMYLKDTQDARAREKSLNESDHASWLSKNLTSILALTVVVGGGLMLAFISDAEVKYAVVSLMSMVLSYFFGTSMGSTKAQQALRDVASKVKPL